MPPSKRVPRRRSTWTSEDSKKEMEKWVKNAQTAPAVAQVHQTLEKNLEYFMKGVGTLVEKYEALAAKVREEIAAQDADVAIKQKAEQTGNQKDYVIIRMLRPLPPKVSKKDPASPTSPKTEDNDDDEDDYDDNTSATSEYDPSPNVKAPEFPSNEKLLEFFAELKKEAYELNVTFNGIHDWIALSLPDLKFGEDEESMEVADTMMSQVSSLDETLQGVYSFESKYVEGRTDLECEMLKYPDSTSLPILIRATDETAWRDIEHSYTSMVRVCIILHTHLNRNMATLQNPRGQRVNLSM